MTPIASPAVTMTADEYIEKGFRYPFSELVRGRVRVREPASGGHGVVTTVLTVALHGYVEAHRLGVVFGDGAGYELPGLPDTVRAPDVSFVRADQLPSDGFGRGWIGLAPDLAVEVLSPSDAAWELDEKLEDYRTAGTRLVWVIDLDRRTVAVHSADAPERWLREGDVLDGGAVVPGFTIPVATLFARVKREVRER